MYELDLNLLQREAKLAVNYRSMPLHFPTALRRYLKQFKLTFRQAKLFKMHCVATIITALCVISGL